MSVPPLFEIALHPGDALLLERFVADGEHLVGDQDVGRQRGGDREAQSHDHARRVMLDRIVDVLADVGKGDDFVALRALISAGARPSSVAARSMFARPVYSGWKPEPSSSSAPTRPLTATVPRVGLMTPATIFSSVDFPAPFSPITPSDSPRFNSSVTPSSARNTCAAGRPRKRSATSRSRPPRESTFA